MAIFQKELIIKGQRVEFRSLEPKDAEAMLAMLRQLDEETDFLMREPGEMKMTLEQEEAFLRQCMENPLNLFICAEVNGKLIGSCNASIGTMRRTRHMAEVGIAVLKAHWSQGIGRALMEESIAWLSDNGVERMTLSVDTQNLRAIALYMRLGFIVEGTLTDVRKMADGTYRDDYRMTLNLLR